MLMYLTKEIRPIGEPLMLNFFKQGKITLCCDGGPGSSGKGGRAAHLWKYHKAPNATFANNTFMANAAHTITHNDGREIIHQCLSSITTLGNYQKQYLGPGCVFSTKEILGEIERCGIKPSQLGIHPNAVIVTQKDIDYEKGLVDFEGNPKAQRDCINLKIGSTLHGVGAARARRILRRPDVVLVKNIPELQPYLCDTQHEIMNRLQSGESGLGEIAQGYQLSLMSHFFPHVTSRNVSIAAFLDDALLPPIVAGSVILNFRTYPIRVNNNKYIRKSDGKILTWSEWQSTPEADKEMIQGDSGAGYSDQSETSWEQVSKDCGEEVFEQTSLTKLPRRVFSFSKVNLIESMIYNNTGHDMFLSINFMNYVDKNVNGKRDVKEVLTCKVRDWLNSNVFTSEFWTVCKDFDIRFSGLFIGTWKTIDDSMFISRDEILELL
jgi:hypothetical protein